MAAAFCSAYSGPRLRSLINHSIKKVNHSRLSLLNASKRLGNNCFHDKRFWDIGFERQSKAGKKYLSLRALHKGEADLFQASKEEKGDDISKATLIWRAIKLPIYSVAVIPLTVGSAAAYLQTGVFSIGRYFVLLASSIMVITWLNLSNDAYDYDTGADKNKKESVVNLIGHRTGTLILAYSLLALGFMGLTWTSMKAGNIRAVLLLACAIFVVTYIRRANYVPVTSTILSASLLVGLTTTLILFCSHFHQVEEDLAVRKISPLVRLGTKYGSEVVKMAVVVLYSILLPLGLSKVLPLTCIFLCALTLPLGNLVVRFVTENHENKEKIFMAKYYCVRLHALFGTALAAGLVIARVATNRYIP